MLLALLLPISVAGAVQLSGAALYVVGLAAYAMAWAAQILFPRSAWSTGTAGFLAPAFTPALWLTGIGLIGIRPLTPHTGALLWIFLAFHNQADGAYRG